VENIVERVRPHMTRRHVCISCWIAKTTDAHSEYVIPIPFQLQQLLNESVSMLRHTYIACLVLFLRFILTNLSVANIMLCLWRTNECRWNIGGNILIGEIWSTANETCVGYFIMPVFQGFISDTISTRNVIRTWGWFA